MKRCPTCQTVYEDEALGFCRVDGAPLDRCTSELSESAATRALPSSRTTGEASPEATPSIAVLPFVNMSSDPENEYFCDGLAEELINALTRDERLCVVARTSAFSFKGRDTNIRHIGRVLRVGAVLEGSVRKAGDHVRVTAQLIDAADGYHLWSERYDRRLEDVFEIQDELSLAIAAALKVKLLGEDEAAVRRHYAADAESGSVAGMAFKRLFSSGSTVTLRESYP
jgi:adenylate cyclase